MRPIAELSEEDARRLRALLFDLDDTLLDGTTLTEAAYSSLFRLRESGLALVAVTGRPSGWGEVIARQWPIDGAVTENGAVACHLQGGKLELSDFAGPRRAERRARLDVIVRAVFERFPDLRASDDVSARRSDFTFDIGEHERVPRAVVDEARAFVRGLGARTTTSSVHLHVTLDGLDKAAGAVRFLGARFGWDFTESTSVSAFIGDSENDAACFGAFRTTFAVHNFRARLTVPPRFVTRGERGTGFAEAASVLVARRATGQKDAK
jgi:hypothetical protein